MARINKLMILAYTAFASIGAAHAAPVEARQFDFVAPVVVDDTVPPKQAGSIFFNATAGAFQGFDIGGNTLTLSGGSTGMKTVTVSFGGSSEGSTGCVSDPCSIYRQSGEVDQVSYQGPGVYTIEFTPGTFSGLPTCTGSVSANITPSIITFSPQNSTADAMKVYTFSSSAGTAANQNGYVICIGPQ